MKVTMGDVAQKAGVSKTTVSRILNGNYAHTTEVTKERVLKAIKELDYRPNAVAKSLKSMKTNVIGIVLSNLKNPFWATVLEGVEDTCNKLGYNLMICNTNEEQEKEENYIRALQTKQVDGIVINPTVRNLQLYDELILSTPTVFINRRITNMKAHTVVVNNIHGAFIAVSHLLSLGRKKIAIIAFENPGVSTWKERVEGYQQALLKNGYSENDFRILRLEQKSPDIKEHIKQYLRENPDTDAIFSSNNMITLEVMGAVKELNLKIPEQMAVVGYDETVWAKYLDPPLTTIRQPGYLMGTIAAENLIESIGNKNTLNHEAIVLEPELITRESCGSKI